MITSPIRLNEYEAKLVADQDVLRRAAHNLIAAYQNLQFEMVCGTLEAAAKSLNAYCRAIGKCLVFAAYQRMICTYPKNYRGNKKNTRLRRVAKRGAASAAVRLSILSDLRQRRAFNPKSAGRQRNKIKQHGVKD